jgi:hypothetical protein
VRGCVECTPGTLAPVEADDDVLRLRSHRCIVVALSLRSLRSRPDFGRGKLRKRRGRLSPPPASTPGGRSSVDPGASRFPRISL